jgi:hypothetical protein
MDFRNYKIWRETAMPNTSHALHGFELNWKNVWCIQLMKSNAKGLFYKQWHDINENSSHTFFSWAAIA